MVVWNARPRALRLLSVVFVASIGACPALGCSGAPSPVERADQNGGVLGHLWPAFVPVKALCAGSRARRAEAGATVESFTAAQPGVSGGDIERHVHHPGVAHPTVAPRLRAP